MSTITRISTRDWQGIAKALANGDDFKTHGSLSGEAGPFTNWQSGQLPSEHVSDFVGAAYAVFSYATPVAWKRDDGTWVQPRVRYSLTTTRQQGTVATAISVL